VEALPFLSAVADFPYLDGRMVAKIDAHGRGSSPRAVMSSLSGAVALRFDNGEIRGVNVSQMVRTLAAKILSGWNESRAEKTDLTEMSALFRIQDGRATTDNLRLIGPLVRVSGAGTVDIGAKMLAFRLDPKVVMSLEGQGSAANPVGLGVPVVVQGPWGAPRIYPEIAGILDNPDAAFGQLRELGSGLLKGSGLPKLPGGLSPGGSGSGGSTPGGSLSGGSLTQGIESLFGTKDGGKQSPLPNLRQGR
jgi:AsmA protein